ncbi:DUF4190 domain-containing protein [Billgrantia endophytica]|uniref:DUF4190 domain-containing protein n=1 Tax=Billgrantia endophytica TaxID=2033802 RepID=A0A2N7U900_9GAMM|nr:DUF4190 domain-containing protein [Halomonas endophytica]PMR76916.1 hypothetical protein C1H69_04230 [Halomonas endophytica]
MESDNTPRRQYSPWAMASIVTALISLLLAGSMPPVNIAAAIFAVMGLRQIRRDPDRYTGRAFCWIAIALALILAILTAMVQPQTQVGTDGFMVPDEGAGAVE